MPNSSNLPTPFWIMFISPLNYQAFFIINNNCPPNGHIPPSYLHHCRLYSSFLLSYPTNAALLLWGRYEWLPLTLPLDLLVKCGRLMQDSTGSYCIVKLHNQLSSISHPTISRLRPEEVCITHTLTAYCVYNAMNPFFALHSTRQLRK